MFSVYNESCKDTIVFFNGAGMGQWMWQNQIDYFTSYRIITFDYDGHIKNSPNYSSMTNEINKVKDYLLKFKINKLIIIGFSIGAQTCLLAKKELNADKAVIISALNKKNLVQYYLLMPFIFLSMPLVKSKTFAKLSAKQMNIPNEMFNNYFNTSKLLSFTSMKNILKENMSFDYLKDESDILVIYGQNEHKTILSSASKIALNSLMFNDAAHDIPYNHCNKLNEIIANYLK